MIESEKNRRATHAVARFASSPPRFDLCRNPRREYDSVAEEDIGLHPQITQITQPGRAGTKRILTTDGHGFFLLHQCPSVESVVEKFGSIIGSYRKNLRNLWMFKNSVRR
ncbi:MAG: hypothetical protein WD069_21200 [Planctomycetales bacterium]